MVVTDRYRSEQNYVYIKIEFLVHHIESTGSVKELNEVSLKPCMSCMKYLQKNLILFWNV